MTREVAYGLVIFVTLMVWLIGFSVIVGLDPYTDKNRKKLFAIIIVLVFSHILQNYFEYWLTKYQMSDIGLTIVVVYGYVIRPAMLTIFAYFIAPKGKHYIAWGLVVINAIIYSTAFYSGIAIHVVDNRVQGGIFQYWGLVTCMILYGYLIYRLASQYKKVFIKEIIFHLFWLFLIVAGFVTDIFLNKQWLWIDYITISMVTATVLSYMWLHQRFVHEYQTNFIAEQRNRIILSQIQPHFIYNTLSSIKSIEGNPEETKRAITEFANYIRGNLAALDGKELIPFKQELEYVKDYVSLQQRRFPDRIEMTYDVADDDFSVPPLTVQILVENAVKHGVSARYEGGKITLRTYRERKNHVIVVTDDGVGFDTRILETTDRVGLRAVKNRLEYYLNGTVSIESTIGVGTEVTIKIPDSPLPKNMVFYEKKGEKK